ncbi:MAG TPA: LLM class flavin-dependent oxidoreductase [Acidimicrobiales bacterium]|nr:LLM class flavin-dependent oxidoreductase [Acidimicrobiales bacterium]
MAAERRTGILLGSWPLGMPDDDRFYLRVPRQVEDAGFQLLFVGDHMFAKGPNPDALTLLGALAALTTRVTIGSAVLLLPLRDPVIAAKQAATVDLISGGRLVLGVGVGGEFEWEWNAMGVPREGRGRRVDEYLALMRALWSGKPVDHAGPLRPVSGVTGSPAPSREGGPPIWIGGRGDAALARAARHDGWCAYAMSPRRLRAGIDRIAETRGGLDGFRVSAVVFTCVDADERRARDTAARVLGDRYSQDFDHFLDAFCAVGAPGRVAERIAEFHAAGVDDTLLCPQVPANEFEAQVDAVADAVLR